MVCPVIESIATGSLRETICIYAMFQGAVWTFLLTWIVHLYDRRWLKALLLMIFGFAALVEIIHYKLLHMPVDVRSVLLVLDTNTHEVSGFFKQFMSLEMTVWLVVGLLAVVVTALAISKSDIRIRRWNFALSAVVILLVSGGMIRLIRVSEPWFVDSIEDLVLWNSDSPGNPVLINSYQMSVADPITKTIYLTKSALLELSIYGEWEKRQLSAYQDKGDGTVNQFRGDSLNIVMIIGESFIKSHSSLYGYHLATNPLLEREEQNGALVAYTDIIAGGNYTNLSICNLMNLNWLISDDESQRNWWRNIYFPIIFKKSGWDVKLFSNQYSPEDVSSGLGRLFFNKLMTDSIYTSYSNRTYPYDGDFVKAMIREHNLKEPNGGNNLTIWHLNGQHFPAKTHYPESTEYERFTLKDIPADKPWLDDDKRQQVAEYANATAYNDKVVYDLISLYKDRNAVVIYFSDHGEEMWDTAEFGNRNKPRPEDSAWMHRQFDVPFFVWMSPQFKASHGDVVSAIRRAAGRPGTLDGIGYVLLDIGGINSTHNHPERCLLSDRYECKQRVTAQGYAYPD